MKSSNIAENVFGVNLKYSRLQNKSKELFFKCLDEGRDVEYFEEELRKIWNINDKNYIENQIIEYRSIIHEINTNKEMTEEEKKNINVIGLAMVLGLILSTNELFKKDKIKEYDLRLNSYAYKADKQEYLKKLIPKYTNDIKPYYKKGMPKTKENMVREVKPSTYNAMVYNTTLTKNGWIQTLNDGLDLGVGYFYVGKHSFSCHYCAKHQDRKMTREECLDILGTAEDGATELLHPNCKCELVFYETGKKLKPYTKKELAEIDEQYHIREKVMALELKKEETVSNMKIARSLGDEGLFDKYNQQRNKINSSIRELQEALPTTELKKQVVAINR